MAATIVNKITPSVGEFYFAAENVVRYRCRFRLSELPNSFQCVDPDADVGDSLVVASGNYYPEKHYDVPYIYSGTPSARWSEFYAGYFGYESYGTPLGASWDENYTTNHVTSPIDFPITTTGINVAAVDESSPWTAPVLDQIECLPACDGTQFQDRPDSTVPTIDACSVKNLTARWKGTAVSGTLTMSGNTATASGPRGFSCKVDQAYLQTFGHNCVMVANNPQILYEWQDSQFERQAGHEIAALLPM